MITLNKEESQSWYALINKFENDACALSALKIIQDKIQTTNAYCAKCGNPCSVKMSHIMDEFSVVGVDNNIWCQEIEDAVNSIVARQKEEAEYPFCNECRFY